MIAMMMSAWAAQPQQQQQQQHQERNIGIPVAAVAGIEPRGSEGEAADKLADEMTAVSRRTAV